MDWAVNSQTVFTAPPDARVNLGQGGWIMRRHELDGFEWPIIKPLLPKKARGVPRVDDRRVLNGIHWRFRTGSPSSMPTVGQSR